MTQTKTHLPSCFRDRNRRVCTRELRHLINRLRGGRGRGEERKPNQRRIGNQQDKHILVSSKPTMVKKRDRKTPNHCKGRRSNRGDVLDTCVSHRWEPPTKESIHSVSAIPFVQNYVSVFEMRTRPEVWTGWAYMPGACFPNVRFYVLVFGSREK